MIAAGLTPDRFAEVVALASTRPVYPDQPDRPENRRITVVVLGDAPTLPYGYLTCMVFVYVAPTWYRNRMTPLVLDWDRRFASPAERRLAAQANRASGLRELTLATDAA